MTIGSVTISDERKPLLYSLGIHLLIVITAFVRPYFSAEVKPFERAIRVDIVAMPDKNQKIIKKTEVAKKKTVKKDTKTKPKAKTKSQTKSKPTAPIKDSAKVISKKTPIKKTQKIKKDNAQTKELEENAFAKLARLREEKNLKEAEEKKIAGNRASKGTDLTGVEKIEYSNYRSTLHTAISSEWDVPKWLLEGNLSAVVHIKIDESGNLIYKKIIRGSGNSIYDEKVIGAIEDAAPFSPPPEKFKKIVYYEGVELSFPR